MSTPTFKNTDAAIDKVVAWVEGQYTAMEQTRMHIDGITDAVRDSFQGAASTVFQDKMREWGEEYAKVTAAYREFEASLNAGKGQLANAGDHTVKLAMGIGGGGGSTLPGYIEGVLNP
ncbi:WXG100 family type VII secretion target [Kitasatospora sp. NPDC088134]|uniref:WXG100 family type VII secretion target n=1 Tax=Kitasatospora sp. NPDC088134 TaxID=3364071 RepID=UPI0037FED8C3